MTTIEKKTGTKEWADKNINFSKGCSNNCKYCYACTMGYRFGWKELGTWDQMINNESMWTKNFRKYNGTIMIPSSHDITETNIDLAIHVIRKLLDVGNKLLIVTKPRPQLIERIVKEVLYPYNQLDHVYPEYEPEIRVTLGTFDNEVLKIVEPDASTFEERVETLDLLDYYGIKASVSAEPYLTREVVKLFIMLVEDYGLNITNFWIGKMNNFSQIVNKYPELEFLRGLYTNETVLDIYQEFQNLADSRIKFKDTFRKIIGVD